MGKDERLTRDRVLAAARMPTWARVADQWVLVVLTVATGAVAVAAGTGDGVVGLRESGALQGIGAAPTPPIEEKVS